jgi:DNA-binding IclR family transcriptional regulator
MRKLHEPEPSDAPPLPEAESPTGTRSVQRTLALLKELSSRGEFGWRLSDLARQVGLDRATCHRMLACLIKEGFAQRHDNDLKYYPGQLIFEMGLALPPYEALRERVEPRLAEICRATGCIASFSLRSGNDVVCVFQQRCGIELSAMMIRVGTRRPMFAAVGGLCILQRLPEAEAARIVEENTQRELTMRGPHRLAALARMRRRSEAAGYGYTIGDLAPGVRALAVPVHDANGEPFAALTLTGSDATMTVTDERVAGCHALMLQVAALIEADALTCLRKPARGTSH